MRFEPPLPNEGFPSDQELYRIRRLWNQSVSGRSLGLEGGWSYLNQCVHILFKRPQSWIAAELGYMTFDDARIEGSVPLYRTACELKITRPGFFDITVPAPNDVRLLLDRYHA